MATLGVYDGVHLGHRRILSEVAAESSRLMIPSAAVTFSPHPSRVLPGNPAGLITDEEEKLKLLEACGLDFCFIIDFSIDFSRQTPERFVKETLEVSLGVKTVIVGFSHVFGARRRGNAGLLTELSGKHGFELKLVDPVKIEGETVSSSRIRQLLAAGDTEKANLLLGRNFSIGGTVEKGEGRGAALGFPTANISLPRERLRPAAGVYAGAGEFNGIEYPAVLYTGKKPTFEKTLAEPSIEIHLIGFSGDLYGRRVDFRFKRRIRPDIRFKSTVELKEKIADDIKKASASYRR